MTCPIRSWCGKRWDRIVEGNPEATLLRVKVIEVPFAYYPDAVGGPGIYVEALAQRLLVHGVESVIAASAGAL